MGNNQIKFPQIKKSDKIKIFFFKPYFFDNDIISGKIQFLLKTNFFYLILKRIEYYLLYDNKPSFENQDETIIFKQKYEFKSNNNNNNSFEFKIPVNDLEPSFEYYKTYKNVNNNQKVVFMKYVLKVVCIDEEIIHEDFIFIKKNANTININTDTSLQINKIIYSLGFIEQGLSFIKLDLKKNNFNILENIEAQILIDNSKCKIKAKYIQCYILRKLYLYKSNKFKNSFIDYYNKHKKLINLNPNSKIIVTFNLSFKPTLQTIPNFPNNNFTGLELSPTCNGNIFTNNYFIVAELILDCANSKNNNPKIEVPIYIGNIPYINNNNNVNVNNLNNNNDVNIHNNFKYNNNDDDDNDDNDDNDDDNISSSSSEDFRKNAILLTSDNHPLDDFN